MNLINELGNELAVAVLIEKRHSEKMSSKDVLPLIKRIKDASQLISSEEDPNKAAETIVKAANNSAP